jgi:hypothetical protein
LGNAIIGGIGRLWITHPITSLVQTATQFVQNLGKSFTGQAGHVLKKDEFRLQNSCEPNRTENQSSAAVCPVPAPLAAERLTGGAHHKKIEVTALK